MPPVSVVLELELLVLVPPALAGWERAWARLALELGVLEPLAVVRREPLVQVRQVLGPRARVLGPKAEAWGRQGPLVGPAGLVGWA